MSLLKKYWTYFENHSKTSLDFPWCFSPLGPVVARSLAPMPPMPGGGTGAPEPQVSKSCLSSRQRCLWRDNSGVTNLVLTSSYNAHKLTISYLYVFTFFLSFYMHVWWIIWHVTCSRDMYAKIFYDRATQNQYVATENPVRTKKTNLWTSRWGFKQHIKSKIHFAFLKEMAKKRLWKLEGICCATRWNKNKFLPAIPPKHDIWYSFHLATSSLTSHLNQASTWQYPHPSHHPIIPSRYWCTNVKRVMSWSIWASLAISRWSTLSTCSNCAWTWSSSGVGADSLVAKTRNWELLQKVGTMSGHPTTGWRHVTTQTVSDWVSDCEFCKHLASVIYTPGLSDLWETKRLLYRSWCRMLCRTDWDKALSLPVQVLVLATKDKGDIQRKWHSNNRRHRDVSVH